MLKTRRHDRRSGQSLAEFAIVLPVLALLLFGIVQFGITFGGYNALINSVREAARYGSVCSGGPSVCGQPTADYAHAKICQSGFGYDAGTVVATVGYDTYREPPTTGLWNVRMHVTGSVGSTIFIPLIGNVMGLQNSQSLPLTSNEDFRVEGAPSQADPSLTGTGWSTTYTTSGACP